MAISYPDLQSVFNQQLDFFLSSAGLSTPCLLNLGTNASECPNCIYDNILKKSSNIYKTGGPVNFTRGSICPFCRGSGQQGSAKTVTIQMAILWDYKSWIIKPINLENPDGFVQSICHKSYTPSILQCSDMTVLNTNQNNPVFSLFTEPTPAGLGDQNYIISQWKKIRK
jgi:hypothetical protein